MSATVMLEGSTNPTVLLPIANASKQEENAINGKIPILLPDMFVSFMAQKPRVNPHYASVRKESETWINGLVFRSSLSAFKLEDGH